MPKKGPQPPINTNRSLSFITGVVVDRAGLFKDFGDVIEDVEDTYQPGEVASVRFVGANPRNDLRLERTYALVERLATSEALVSSPLRQESDELKPRLDEGTWVPFRSDEDWEVVFNWKRTSTLAGTSEVTIQWEIPVDEHLKGTFRIRYFGNAKSIGGTITAFEGVSKVFEIR
jgi:neutral ceramidase